MRLYLFFVLIAGCLNVSAQIDSSKYTSQDPNVFPLLVPKVDAFSLLGFKDASVLLSMEFFPFINFFSIAPEIGYVYDIPAHQNVDIVKSLKYGGDIRLYVPNGGSNYANLYFVGSYQVRHLTMTDQYVLGYDCGDDCKWFQKYESDIPTIRYSRQLGLGLQIRYERVVVEGDFNYGIRYTVVEDEGFRNADFIEPGKFLAKSDLSPNEYVVIRLKLGFVMF